MKKVVLCLVAVSLFVGMLIACSDNGPGNADPKKFAQERGIEGNGLTYYVLEIEGMTCVYVEKTMNKDTQYTYGYAGLTCNWSEREAVTDCQ